jgi:hypothetical protein
MRERRAELDTFTSTLRALSPDLLPPEKEEMLLWALEVASSRAIGESCSNGTAATMVSLPPSRTESCRTPRLGADWRAVPGIGPCRAVLPPAEARG